ncbi:glutaredoxin domain-containing protein [uncultured Streptomyces sp.]|uniref:glutaredoxin domain-containing protein n=1 Tax=uncultured Streptomyces sp. TaxID=174707 RepID=UPI002630BB12|nr:glutaredoxin domain-containing protein [uncultured Streptomyces sp.]
MTRAWIMPTLFAACALLGGSSLIRRDVPVGAAVLALFFLFFAWLNSPLAFPRPLTAAEAQRRSADDGRPIVYWRPGCTYCMRLRMRLGRRGRRAHWVDIWRDPAAAAVVRAANDGNETVPTVFVAGRPHVNPDPAWVRDRLTPTA